MTHNKSIYIFHRALRLTDNTGLTVALKESKQVIPIFIFTPEQITSQNKFRSLFAVKFMIDALMDLDKSLNKLGSRLYIFYGKQPEVLQKILRHDTDIDTVIVNKDYTPYAISREAELKKICENENRTFESYEDYLLHDINTVLNKSGTFYSVFTPFYNAALKFNVAKPKIIRNTNFVKKKYSIPNQTTFDKIKHLTSYNNTELYEFIGTREEGEKRLKNIKNQKNYANDRDNLCLETTRLSPYIKFGIVSIREVYHRIQSLYNKHHPLIRQLYWRDFYYILSFNRTDLLEDSTSFRESYDNIDWWSDAKSKRFLQLWKDGKTGYPVVDAGMRELNMTGYMHNRARLITSNFLVKHLFIDWREGERYFASKLIDYDPSVNNGNWQFTSGSGADSEPYFRMINPILQEIKHDKSCGYIKAWIPELMDVPNEDIHDWQNVHEDYHKIGIDYPAPCKMYDYAKLKKESKKVYKKAFTS